MYRNGCRQNIAHLVLPTAVDEYLYMYPHVEFHWTPIDI